MSLRIFYCGTVDQEFQSFKAEDPLSMVPANWKHILRVLWDFRVIRQQEGKPELFCYPCLYWNHEQQTKRVLVKIYAPSSRIPQCERSQALELWSNLHCYVTSREGNFGVNIIRLFAVIWMGEGTNTKCQKYGKQVQEQKLKELDRFSLKKGNPKTAW